MTTIRKELASFATPINDVIPHPQNVRQGDVGAIAESLKAHGQYRPILVQKKTKYILAGNHTYAAAKALGWKEIAAQVLDVNDDEARRILLVDNRTNDLAAYDDGALAQLLTELAHSENDLLGTGFERDDLDDLLFRLNGQDGNFKSKLSNEERTEDWLARQVRSIILQYSSDDFEEMIRLCDEARDKLTIATNSDLFKTLVLNALSNS